MPVPSMVYTLGMIDFRSLKKFNGCNFHIFITVFDALNCGKKIFDLAKCPLWWNVEHCEKNNPGTIEPRELLPEFAPSPQFLT